MKYIKFYENIDWNDWDEEEVDTAINVGDFVKCKYATYKRSYSSNKNDRYITGHYDRYSKWYEVCEVDINNDGSSVFQIVYLFPWYISDEWEKKI